MPTLATNKHARFHYDILDEFEAGIALTGAEVKAVRLGQVNLKGSYVSIHENIPLLFNCHISPYAPAKGNQRHYLPTRPRLLLLREAEIKNLIGKSSVQGLTLIPLSLYTKGSLIKVSLGLGRGKKQHDKRATVKKRETERNIRRALKRSR
ncbi:MAG: SsrA-binding protein SmpB [Patescibacteria group bacterium]|nr:SsrA-binding protein SmpB [Patescibacteria group bacterium]